MQEGKNYGDWPTGEALRKVACDWKSRSISPAIKPCLKETFSNFLENSLAHIFALLAGSGAVSLGLLGLAFKWTLMGKDSLAWTTVTLAWILAMWSGTIAGWELGKTLRELVKEILNESNSKK